MPSLTSPNSPASQATLETLLLCAEVVQNGETAQSFNIISSSLKENPLLTGSPSFDPGRLSGDTLRERWRDLLKDEGFISGNGTAPTGRASGRNGQGSTAATAGNAAIGEKAVRDLTRRWWETYQNMMKDHIRADEAEIAHLLDEIGNLENEEAKELEAAAAEKEAAAAKAAKVAAEQLRAETPAKSISSPIPAKTQPSEAKKAEEVPVDLVSAQQQAGQVALRTEPPSPSKASLKNILSDEPTPLERSIPLERQTSLDSIGRVSYDPIRDGGRSRDIPQTISETPQQRYPPIQPAESMQGGYQIYEKPPQSIRRLSGSGPRPHPPPEFMATSPGRPPVTPTGPRIGTFPPRGTDMATSPNYSRHEHDPGFQNGQQSPLNALAHVAAGQPGDVRTPRQMPIPPSYSPTTTAYQPQSSPSRSHYTQALPSIHQISPQRGSAPPPFPSPMQRLPSQEYLPHHSPTSDHQPLHSPMGYNSNVQHSPFSHQSSLPHPSPSPRGSFSQPSMPPPHYSPTHGPQQYYQGQYPPPHSPSLSYNNLQPAFQPQPSREYAPPPTQMQSENRLPPINTPTQLAPLQYATPKPSEPGRNTSPLRPRPEEISPVLGPDNESGDVPDMELDDKTTRKKKPTKGRPLKVESAEEIHEPAPRTRRGSRQESAEPHEDKTAKPARGKAARGASKSRGTAVSSRTRRGQSVSSVGARSTAEPEDMDIDNQTTKEESVAPETIAEEPMLRKGSKGKRGGRTTRKQAAERETRQELSTEPETANTEDNAHVETPQDRATPAEPATPRPPFTLDLSVNATPTSSSATQVKKFAQRANPLLTNVAAHRFANLFMKPVDDKMAPAYSNTVYRPQDIKSIRGAIKTGAAQTTGTGTPTPTPTADAPSASFGTTPSTPTTAASNAGSKGAITNSAQLEKEIWRMFANAVMYNKSSSVIAEQAREMARDVGAAIDNFRNAERIGEKKAAEAAAKERERGVAAGLSNAAKRRGSLIKSEVMGDDESRKGYDDDDEEEDEEEETPRENAKKGKAGARTKSAAATRSRRGKKDSEGDLEMEDKAAEEEEAEQESSDADRTADEADEEEEDEEAGSNEEDNDEEQSEEDGAEEEDEEDEEVEKVEKSSKTAKGKASTKAATASRAKNTKTRAATAAAPKGRGNRKGSAAVDADEEETDKSKAGRGRGAGRTRATKGR